jgi:glucose/arabinose dehydrogenase
MTPTPHPAFGLGLQRIIVSLSFPVFVTAPPGDSRLFVVEKGGIIKVFDVTSQPIIPIVFLNLPAVPVPPGQEIATNGEQGLLGLAFHPNFSQNGFFYINVVTQAGFTEIRRYQVSMGNSNLADPSTGTLIIRIDQRLPNGDLFTNHKAGWLGFGPDSLLYVALGDGGSGGDPQNVAQNVNILLGKMLRLNVDLDEFPADPARNYAIPAGNPFVNIAGADEIWALGLRNPWRASFDRGTGDFYIADVGQGAREEVNASTSATGGGNGANYGWKIMEGTTCFSPPCNVPDLTPPVLEYDHSNGACSITGGYVYRGTAVPALQGTYFYADYCLGFVRSFKLVNGMVTEHTDWSTLDPPGENITSFGEDAAGEHYIATQQGGLYRIVPN